MVKELLRPLVPFVLAALVVGCTAGNGDGLDQGGRPLEEGGGGGELGPTFGSIQSNVFDVSCAVSGCHIGAGAPQGLRLDAGFSYALLVAVPSNEVSALLRVEPLEPDLSYLIQKVEGTAASGARMPLGRPALPQEAIDAMRQWISDGALPDDDPGAQPTAPLVVSVTPEDGALLDALPGEITAIFNEDMDASLAGDTTVVLSRSGGNGGFDDGDDVLVSPAAIAFSSDNPRLLTIDLTGVDAVEDDYRLTLVGEGPTVLASQDGVALDGDGDGVPGGDFVSDFSVASVVPTLAAIQETVFGPTCAVSTCHSGPAGPDLPEGQDMSSAEASFASLVGVTSLEVPALKRVVPGNSDDSYLIQKIEGTADSPRMPLGGDPLSDDTIAAIRGWIDAGALFEPGSGIPDLTPPVVTLAPVASPLAGQVALSANAVDDVAIAEVRFFAGDMRVGTATQFPYAVAWDTTTVVDGEMTLSAEAEDSAGNVGFSSGLVVTVANAAPDVTPPSVVLGPPPDGNLSEVVTLTATAEDDTGVVDVRFFVDGSPIEPDATDDSTADWDTMTVDNGEHVLFAEAADAAGNVGRSDTVTVTVLNDTLPPEVSLTAPDAGAMIEGVETLSAVASDDNAVASVEFLLNGTRSAGTVLAAPYDLRWDSTSVANGEYTLTARAVDQSGAEANSEPVVITVLNEKPTVQITSPLDGMRVAGLVVVEVTASDSIGVTDVEVLVGDVLKGSDATEPYRVSVDTTSLLNRPYEFVARARDAAGNVGRSVVNVTVDNTCTDDVEVPTVVLTAPMAGAPVSGAVTLSATAEDNVGVVQVLFFAGDTLIDSVASMPFETPWDTTDEAEGDVVLTASASDACGNSTTSEPVPVTIDNTPLTVMSVTPESGSVVPALPGEVSIELDEAPDADTVNETTVLLERSVNGSFDDGDDLPVAGTVSVAGTTITLDLSAAMDIEDSYRLRVLDTIKDVAGNALDGDGDAMPGGVFSATFTVRVPLQVLSTDPAGGVTVFDFPAAVTVTFNKAVDAGTVDATSFNLLRSVDGVFDNGDDEVVPGTVGAAGDVATLDLSALLPTFEDSYRVQVSEAITDAGGSALDGDSDSIPGGDFASAFTTILTTYDDDSQPFLLAKCAPCHTTLGFGGQNIGTEYDDAYQPSGACPGLTVAECGLVRVQNGSMPQGAGCTGDPALDIGNSACLTQAEQDIMQAWIDDGLPE